MFAIAAFAIGVMAVNPVLAAVSDHVYDSTVANSGINAGTMNNDTDCGSDSSDYCQAKAKTYTAQNKVRVYYGTSGTTCDVSSTLKEGSTVISTKTYTGVSSTGSYWTGYPSDVQNGETFNVVNYYTNCT